MAKILVIDDEIEFTNLLKNFFSVRGYQVFVAHRGEDGLVMAAKETPDVYLIDVKMPGMHGDEVLARILANQPEAKCIMVTASEGEEKIRTRLSELGAYACFDKPLTSLRDLEKKVEEALGK
jgi:DNA-binding response OmpR family regulator